MNDSFVIKALWVVNAVVIVLGVSMTVGSIRAFEENEGRLAGKLKNLAAMQKIERGVNEHLAAKSVFEEMPESQQPADLATMLRAKFPSYRPDHTRESRINTVPGWVVKQQDIELDNILFEDVMAFVREAEQGRPPWYLHKCVFRASSRTSGKGKVILTIRALKRL